MDSEEEREAEAERQRQEKLRATREEQERQRKEQEQREKEEQEPGPFLKITFFKFWVGSIHRETSPTPSLYQGWSGSKLKYYGRLAQVWKGSESNFYFLLPITLIRSRNYNFYRGSRSLREIPNC